MYYDLSCELGVFKQWGYGPCASPSGF